VPALAQAGIPHKWSAGTIILFYHRPFDFNANTRTGGDDLVPERNLIVEVVVSDMFAENAYIAHLEGSSECVVVDPGFDADRIAGRIEQKGLTPVGLLNTHGHADHIAGNGSLKQRWPDCPLIIGAKEAPKLTDPMANLSGTYGVPIVSPPADQQLVEGDICAAAGLDLEVLETPGHSAGHVVYVWRGATPWVVFAGDVLFQGSIGRADFPDSNPQQLLHSIRTKLYTLPDDTMILPGHGDSTTIGSEKRFNPFVRAESV
jgi:glyoxylase-like metal-dependent hydrolase (beta-lactamase superfamily II)